MSIDIIDDAPDYANLFWLNRGRWPTYEEMCEEHEWLRQRAAAVYDAGHDAEVRGAPRTTLAAKRSEYDDLVAALKQSKSYLEAVSARRASNYEARYNRLARTFRRIHGYLPS